MRETERDARVPIEWEPSLARPSALGVPIDHAALVPEPPRRRLEPGFTTLTWRKPSQIRPRGRDQLYAAFAVLASRAFELDSFPYWHQRQAEGFFDKVSEVTLVLDQRGDIVGWTTMHRKRFAGRRCLYLDSTGVLQQYQHRGFITRLHGKAIAREVVRRPHEPLWVAMRTENPVIYKMLKLGAGRDAVFPPLSGEVPSAVRSLASAVVAWLGQADHFQPETLVIGQAYSDAYKRYDDDRLRSGDDEIDAMFVDRLAVDEAFLMLARVRADRAAVWAAGQLRRRAIGRRDGR